MEKRYDAIIVGGGPAGLSAAIYMARARFHVLVIEKEKMGGQITITSEVVNYPGVYKTDGEALTREMVRQAEAFGAEFLTAEVKSLSLAADTKVVHTDRGDFEAMGIIYAAGAHPRLAGFSGEKEFRGHGVAYCATCDGEFFTGKDIFVVGGGYAAVEEALFLTKYGRKVHVLVRGDDFSISSAAVDELKEHPDVTISYHTEVVRIEGDSAVRRLVLKDRKSGEERLVDAKDGDYFGVFVFVAGAAGHQGKGHYRGKDERDKLFHDFSPLRLIFPHQGEVRLPPVKFLPGQGLAGVKGQDPGPGGLGNGGGHLLAAELDGVHHRDVLLIHLVDEIFQRSQRRLRVAGAAVEGRPVVQAVLPAEIQQREPVAEHQQAAAASFHRVPERLVQVRQLLHIRRKPRLILRRVVRVRLGQGIRDDPAQVHGNAG